MSSVMDSDAELVNLSSDCESIILIDEKEIVEEKLKKNITKLFKFYTLDKAMEKINAIIYEAAREKLLVTSRNIPVEPVAPLSNCISSNSEPVDTVSEVTELEESQERRTNSKNPGQANRSRLGEMKKKRKRGEKDLKEKGCGSRKEDDVWVPPAKIGNLRQIKMSGIVLAPHVIKDYKRLRAEGKRLIKAGELEEALKIFETARGVLPTPIVLRRIEMLKSLISSNEAREKEGHPPESNFQHNPVPVRESLENNSVSSSIASNISNKNEDFIENKKSSSGYVQQSASQGSLKLDWMGTCTFSGQEANCSQECAQVDEQQEQVGETEPNEQSFSESTKNFPAPNAQTGDNIQKELENPPEPEILNSKKNRKRSLNTSVPMDHDAIKKLKQIPDKNKKYENEFEVFCEVLAIQLKKMPLHRALICQEKLQNVMRQEWLFQLSQSHMSQSSSSMSFSFYS